MGSFGCELVLCMYVKRVCNSQNCTLDKENSHISFVLVQAFGRKAPKTEHKLISYFITCIKKKANLNVCLKKT